MLLTGHGSMLVSCSALMLLVGQQERIGAYKLLLPQKLPKVLLLGNRTGNGSEMWYGKGGEDVGISNL